MNYYDEFGVAAGAPVEEIRRAYRTLARLMHPDGQADGPVKAAAERQMKRLNEILAVLSDPVQRRAYDDRLCAHEAERMWLPAPLPRRARRERRRPAWMEAAIQHWFWILTGVTILAAALWYVAAGDSNLAGNNAPADAKPSPLVGPIAGQSTEQRAATAGPAPAVGAIASRTPAESAATVGPARDDGGKQSALRGYQPAEPAGRAGAAPEALAPPAESQRKQLSAAVAVPQGLEPALETRQTAATPAAGLKAPESPFTGNWLYSPDVKEPGGGLYPPTYIEFLVTEEDGVVVGHYRARYKTPEQGVSPEIVFRASGRPQPGKLTRLVWTSEDGAKGEVELALRSPSLMNVTWWTTAFGRRTALASGTALLIREAR